MKNISNPIIPIKQEFYDLRTNKIVNWETNSNNNLDLEAIVSFCSLGFMLDDDTFYNDIKVCKPATEYRLNEKSEITENKQTGNGIINLKSGHLMIFFKNLLNYLNRS